MGGSIQQINLESGRGWLRPDAAASVKRIDAQIGHALQITEAGRTWAQQNAHYQAYKRYLAGGPYAPIALSPDAPSIHQIGAAIDTDEGQRILSVLHDHGWRQTVYRGGKLVEPWHFEYSSSRDNHHGEEPDMALNSDTDYEAFKTMLQRALKFDVRPNGAGADWKLGPTVFESLAGAQNKGVTEDQVKAIADAVIKSIGKPTVTLDYTAIAKAVNDEAAKRLAS